MIPRRRDVLNLQAERRRRDDGGDLGRGSEACRHILCRGRAALGPKREGGRELTVCQRRPRPVLHTGCPEKKDTQKFTSRSGTHVPIFFKLFTSIV